MKPTRLTSLSLAVALAACATAGSDGSTWRGGGREELTREEVRATQHQTLYDVVRTLRPTWLQRRGQISVSDPNAGQVMVYLNDVQAGGADYLRQVNTMDVVSVRYLDARQAAAQFGIRQSGGAAILVSTVADG